MIYISHVIVLYWVRKRLYKSMSLIQFVHTKKPWNLVNSKWGDRVDGRKKHGARIIMYAVSFI